MNRGERRHVVCWLILLSRQVENEGTARLNVTNARLWWGRHGQGYCWPAGHHVVNVITPLPVSRTAARPRPASLFVSRTTGGSNNAHHRRVATSHRRGRETRVIEEIRRAWSTYRSSVTNVTPLNVVASFTRRMNKEYGTSVRVYRGLNCLTGRHCNANGETTNVTMAGERQRRQ